MAGSTATLVAACLLLAAKTYAVPPQVLLGILEVEGGQIGMASGPNGNGTYDLGPMQINEIWLPELSRHWRVDEGTARRWIKDDACVNIGVGAWILRRQIDTAGDLYQGIARYHSATPKHGGPYAQKVVRVIDRLRRNAGGGNR
ncbi:MAG: lytic transglycosylase domain-containing protein [Pseudomonadota bacterium]|nr:lytic transglycosylase domain-containing protein [Pseudomonadota bacterium]